MAHKLLAALPRPRLKRCGKVAAGRERLDHDRGDLQAEGREHPQGDILEAPRDFKLSIKVLGTNSIRQIDIVKNNAIIHTTHPPAREFSLAF